MIEVPEIQPSITDLVKIELDWAPVELVAEALDYFAQFPPGSDFWQFYSKEGIPKNQRGLGSPLVHWFGTQLTRDSQLTAAQEDMPDFVAQLHQMVYEQFGLEANQIQANSYEPGYGLAWHSDKNPKNPFKGDNTVTVSFGAARAFAVARPPIEWGGKLLQPVDEDINNVQPLLAWDVQSGDCAVYDNQLHEDYVHAVLPGPGLRYGITFRQY